MSLANQSNDNFSSAAQGPAIGTPAMSTYGKIGFVVEVSKETDKVWTLGTGSMVRQNYRITIAWEEHVDTFGEGIAEPMIKRGAHLIPFTEREAAAWYASALEAQEIKRKAQSEESDRIRKAQENHEAELKAKTPNWAKAVIIATLEEDVSDSMSDYFNSVSRRYVVLGFSSHTRDLFSEMRKAAALFPETAELAAADDSAEHREKYSMGGGYYLKQGGRYRNGWKVSKERLGYVPRGLALEFSEALTSPKVEPAQKSNQPETSGRFVIEKHVHTLKGFDMWICTMAERVERATYDELLSQAKALGGWYSRAWNGTPAGFAFKKEAAALAFAGQEQPTPPEGPKQEKPKAEPAQSVDKSQVMAEKLDTMAEGLSAKIAERLGDRLSNTPKRALQAAQARQEGRDLERAQKIMRALAKLWAAGEVPELLRGVTSKSELTELAREALDRGRAAYYDAGIPLGKPITYREPASTAKAAALWALLDAPNDEQAQKADKLQRQLTDLSFASIPGYFPTPKALAQRMLDEARLKPNARVLEPSAGSGNIANEARAQGHSVTCFEKWHSLAQVLRDQDHEVLECDFLEMKAPSEAANLFDAVVMNPPFEKGQDMEHVIHAFQFLKPGGALVAIMSNSVTFNSSTKAQAFRGWIDDMGGEIVALPSGSFKESGTGVETVMVKVWAE